MISLTTIYSCKINFSPFYDNLVVLKDKFTQSPKEYAFSYLLKNMEKRNCYIIVNNQNC
jgi:hypothetical protein